MFLVTTIMHDCEERKERAPIEWRRGRWVHVWHIVNACPYCKIELPSDVTVFNNVEPFSIDMTADSYGTFAYNTLLLMVSSYVPVRPVQKEKSVAESSGDESKQEEQKIEGEGGEKRKRGRPRKAAAVSSSTTFGSIGDPAETSWSSAA